VAGGEKKAEAIISIASLRKNMTIITDEGAARKIIKICK
jgi:central glycolytic genes regulator